MGHPITPNDFLPGPVCGPYTFLSWSWVSEHPHTPTDVLPEPVGGPYTSVGWCWGQGTLLYTRERFSRGPCSNWPSFAGRTNAATKASTGRTGIAFHMQTKLPTSITPDCLGATLRSSVRTEKTKSPGGWACLSAHVKMKNRLHSAKGATCSSRLWSRQIMLMSVQPTASIRTSIQRTGVQTGCRSQGRQMQQQKLAQDEQALHSTCRPRCQPFYERMRGSTQTPSKPREKFNTSKTIWLTFPSRLPSLNTVSNITVRAKGS